MDTPRHDMRWFQSRSSMVMIAFLVILEFFTTGTRDLKGQHV